MDKPVGHMLARSCSRGGPLRACSENQCSAIRDTAYGLRRLPRPPADEYGRQLSVSDSIRAVRGEQQ